MFGQGQEGWVRNFSHDARRIKEETGPPGGSVASQLHWPHSDRLHLGRSLTATQPPGTGVTESPPRSAGTLRTDGRQRWVRRPGEGAQQQGGEVSGPESAHAHGSSRLGSGLFILGVSEEGERSKAGCPPQRGWASSNVLQAQMKQGRIRCLCLMSSSWGVDLALPLDLD